MTRYRIQTRTTAGGRTETHVSSVILTHAEALDSLDAERLLARAAGWHTALLGTKNEPELSCTRPGTQRIIAIRESGPFDDTL